VCPAVCGSDVFWYFNVEAYHINGTRFNLTWTTWNGTVIAHLENRTNGTWHVVPDELLFPITYNQTYNYTLNVSDGEINLLFNVTFSTNANGTCHTNVTCPGTDIDIGIAMSFLALAIVPFVLLFERRRKKKKPTQEEESE